MKNIRVLYIPTKRPVFKCSKLAEMFDIDLAGIDPETEISVEQALPAIANLNWKPVKQENRGEEIVILFEKSENEQ